MNRKIEDFKIGELVYTIIEGGYDWMRGYVVGKYDHLPPVNNIYTIKAHEDAPIITRTARQVFRTKNDAIALCVSYLYDEIREHERRIEELQKIIERLNADKTVPKPKET